MRAGTYEQYRWLVWLDQRLDELLTACPEIVQAKYVVVTSFDSGPLTVSDEEQQQGWSQGGEYAYSPRVQSPDDLIYDQYDEWYVFPQPTTLEQVEVFVSYIGFQLQPGLDNPHLENIRQLETRFWQQLQVVAPESYVAEGDCLIFVTQNRALFERVYQWATRDPAPG